MNTLKAWAEITSTLDAVSASDPNAASSDRNCDITQHARANPNSGSSNAAAKEQPWLAPRTVIQQNERQCFENLKDRLAQIPSRSRQKRQTLYIDLWTGQHWLGLSLTYPEGHEILKPISVDTALSIAMVGTYRLLNQPLFSPASTLTSFR